MSSENTVPPPSELLRSASGMGGVCETRMTPRHGQVTVVVMFTVSTNLDVVANGMKVWEVAVSWCEPRSLDFG